MFDKVKCRKLKSSINTLQIHSTFQTDYGGGPVSNRSH